MNTITIPEDWFEHLLNCLANQKFIGEAPVNGDALALGKETRDELQETNQSVIDRAWNEGMSMLSVNKHAGTK